MQEIPAAVQVTGALHRRVPSDLLHPVRVRVPRNAAQRYPSTADLHEEQHVVGDESSPRQNFDGEEVCAGENVHVRPDEFLPGGRASSLRRRCDLVSPQDVADSLI